MLPYSNYTSPSGQIWTTSGVYQDTLPSINSCDSIIKFDLTLTTTNNNVTLSGTTLIANDSSATATYQWIDCNNGGSFIAGANNQSYSPTANGNYAVIIDVLGCSDTSACQQVVGLSIGQTNLQHNLQVYPNPTTGELTLDFGVVGENPKIEIFNAFGQLLSQKSYPSAQIVNFVLGGPNGMYLIRILTEKKESVIKILKE